MKTSGSDLFAEPIPGAEILIDPDLHCRRPLLVTSAARCGASSTNTRPRPRHFSRQAGEICRLVGAIGGRHRAKKTADPRIHFAAGPLPCRTDHGGIRRGPVGARKRRPAGARRSEPKGDGRASSPTAETPRYPSQPGNLQAWARRSGTSPLAGRPGRRGLCRSDSGPELRHGEGRGFSRRTSASWPVLRLGTRGHRRAWVTKTGSGPCDPRASTDVAVWPAPAPVPHVAAGGVPRIP